MQSVGIIGAGAWGTALAVAARRAGRDAVLWALEPEVAEAVNREHVNPLFLPGIQLDHAIQATTDLAVPARADIILLVVPAQHLRASADRLAPLVSGGRPVVICAKGIELGTAALLTEAASALTGATLMVMSGPSFAIEVARGLPTALTLAGSDLPRARAVAAALGSKAFRPYLSPDLVGVQIGGAVKNVLAIACGICVGRRLGDNARAALLTRGLAEIVRLAVTLGGQAETLMGLSGLGDLVLTASSPQSRNYSLGLALGEGKTLEEVLGGRRAVTEGVTTAGAVVALADRRQVDMPICAAMDRILSHGASIDAEFHGLLDRPLKEEVSR